MAKFTDVLSEPTAPTTQAGAARSPGLATAGAALEGVGDLIEGLGGEIRAGKSAKTQSGVRAELENLVRPEGPDLIGEGGEDSLDNDPIVLNGKRQFDTIQQEFEQTGDSRRLLNKASLIVRNARNQHPRQAEAFAKIAKEVLGVSPTAALFAMDVAAENSLRDRQQQIDASFENAALADGLDNRNADGTSDHAANRQAGKAIKQRDDALQDLRDKREERDLRFALSQDPGFVAPTAKQIEDQQFIDGSNILQPQTDAFFLSFASQVKPLIDQANAASEQPLNAQQEALLVGQVLARNKAVFIRGIDKTISELDGTSGNSDAWRVSQLRQFEMFETSYAGTFANAKLVNDAANTLLDSTSLRVNSTYPILAWGQAAGMTDVVTKMFNTAAYTEGALHDGLAIQVSDFAKDIAGVKKPGEEDPDEDAKGIKPPPAAGEKAALFDDVDDDMKTADQKAAGAMCFIDNKCPLASSGRRQFNRHLNTGLTWMHETGVIAQREGELTTIQATRAANVAEQILGVAIGRENLADARHSAGLLNTATMQATVDGIIANPDTHDRGVAIGEHIAVVTQTSIEQTLGSFEGKTITGSAVGVDGAQSRFNVEHTLGFDSRTGLFVAQKTFDAGGVPADNPSLTQALRIPPELQALVDRGNSEMNVIVKYTEAEAGRRGMSAPQVRQLIAASGQVANTEGSPLIELPSLEQLAPAPGSRVATTIEQTGAALRPGLDNVSPLSGGNGNNDTQGGSGFDTLSQSVKPDTVTDDQINTLISATAKEQGVDPAIVQAIAFRETGHLSGPARQTTTGDDGAAIGVFQIHPDAATDVGLKDRNDLFGNIKGGVAFYARMLKQFDGDVRLALSAYNGGAGKVRRNGDKVTDATLEYVNFVMSKADELRKGAGSVTDPAGFPIDLNRPVLENEDGSFSTEQTITVGLGDRFFNIPTIVNGKRVSDDEAVAAARKDLDNVPNFDTLEEAEKAAPLRSEAIARERGRK